MDQEEPRYFNSQPETYGKVLDLLPQDRSTRILDVGAGAGYFCRKLKDLGYPVEACDVSREDFRCADVPFHAIDLNRPIPLADGQYDCVVGIEVIEHVENHFQFIRELIRITKPNGSIIITTPNVLSFAARWYCFLYGYSECSPYPLDPSREDYFMEHVNPISVPQLLYLFERFGADMVALTTNRLRRSSWLPMICLYPLMALAVRLRFLRRKHAEFHELHRRHIRWVLHPANLMGRITIAVASKRATHDHPVARTEIASLRSGSRRSGRLNSVKTLGRP